MAAAAAVAVAVVVAAGIAVGSVAVAVAVDAGPDFAGQNDIECYPKTKKIAAAAAVFAAAVAIEAVGAGRCEIVVAKPKLVVVVVAVSGLRSTILFGIAELEQLVASEAADIVVAAAAAVVAAAAVRLAEDTEARYLQYWIQSRS